MAINNWQPVLTSALNYLQSFAYLGNSEILLQKVFGDQVSFDRLLDGWQWGQFLSLPTLRFVPTAQINDAQGAFAANANTLYLSEELLTQGNVFTLTQVFLEEYGHYLDSQLNHEDTPGDEGEYFAAVVMGQPLSDLDILRLQSENDWAIVTLDGQPTVIEQSGFNIVQITNNSFDDGVNSLFDPLASGRYSNDTDNNGDKLKVSGNKITWESDHGIYLFDSFIPRSLDFYGGNPQINGDSVVWDHGYLGNGISLYKTGWHTPQLLPSHYVGGNNPQVYDGKVVWQNGQGEDAHIFFYDGFTTIALSDLPESRSFFNHSPRIYGSNIVWSSGNWYWLGDNPQIHHAQIYWYNGERTVQLTNSPFFNSSPVVSEQIIAWTTLGYNELGWGISSFDENNGFSEVHIYDINTSQTTQISSASPIRDLQVSGRNTVWQEGSNEDAATTIMFYDGTTVINLSNTKLGGEFDSNPKLFGNKVVWERWDGIDYEIMYYDGNGTLQVTNNNRDDRYPQVSDEIVAWTGYDDNDWEIYQTYIGQDNGLRDKLTTTLIRFQNTDRPGTYLYVGEQEAVSIRQNYRNFVEEGLAFQVATSQTDPLLQPLYRFRNISPGREGTYLFSGTEEAVSIRQNYPNFVEEGIAFYAYSGGVGGGMTNFNRFQSNELSGTYLFAGPAESASIVAGNHPFAYEGPAFAAGG